MTHQGEKRRGSHRPCGSIRSSGRTALWAAVALLAVGAGAAAAQDRLELEDTKIIGNRELPKVLYIVPWKKPLPGDLAGKPPASVVDEALSPIDRDEFRRQIRYDAQLARRLPIDTPVTEKPATPALRQPLRPMR